MDKSQLPCHLYLQEFRGLGMGLSALAHIKP